MRTVWGVFSQREMTMNSLKSVLIEGSLTSEPQFSEKWNKEVCTFRLVSTRYNRKDGVMEQSFYDIEARTKVDLEKCKTLSVGRGVRIVGRMMTERFGNADGTEHHKLTIIAENLEIKPRFDRKPSEVETES